MIKLSPGARLGVGMGRAAWCLSVAWLSACSSDSAPSKAAAGGPGSTSGAGNGALAGGTGAFAAAPPTAGGTPSGTGGSSGVSSGGAPSDGGALGVAGSAGAHSGSSSVSAGAAGAGTAGAPNPAAPACKTDEERKFSFFLTSQAGLQRLSGNPDGFGGDLGGLQGADRICQQLAESSSPCQGSKVWRAFLSTTTEDAVDRIGKGPWYDRRGRLLANGLADLLPREDTEEGGRPANADEEIRNDFPNEDGALNQFADGGTMSIDNHQTLTGSGSDGRLYAQSPMTGSAGASGVAGAPGRPGCPGGGLSGTLCRDAEGWTPEAATCWNWTSKETKGCPRVGHSWGAFSGWDWISVWNESGCAPGGTIRQEGAGDDSRKVGSGGGYGGFYCFAVTP